MSFRKNGVEIASQSISCFRNNPTHNYYVLHKIKSVLEIAIIAMDKRPYSRCTFNVLLNVKLILILELSEDYLIAIIKLKSILIHIK